MRVGIGSVVRGFEPGRTLVLGGLKIEGAWGLRDRGDGDVLLRAVLDALLGAAGLGDASDHEPLDDAARRATPTAVLLAEACAKVRARGLCVANVDATVVLERPDLGPHRAAMAQRIASLLGVEAPCVNVKTSPASGVGALGAGEGVLAHAVVTLLPAAEAPA